MLTPDSQGLLIRVPRDTATKPHHRCGWDTLPRLTTGAGGFATAEQPLHPVRASKADGMTTSLN